MLSLNVLNIRIENSAYHQHDICLSLEYPEEVIQYVGWEHLRRTKRYIGFFCSLLCQDTCILPAEVLFALL